MPGSVPGIFVMYFIHAALHFLSARSVLRSVFLHIEHEDDHEDHYAENSAEPGVIELNRFDDRIGDGCIRSA